MRRRRRPDMRMPIIAMLATVLAFGALGGVAWAAFTGTTSATQTLSSLQLGNPSSATASITTSNPTSCTAITVSWPAAASADSYRIQVRESNGAWTDLVAETGNVTSHVDTTTHTHTVVDYRVYSRDADSDWEGAAPATSNAVTCGIAPVTDLTAANPCSSSTLAWGATTGATHWDVRRRVNGGAWSANLVSKQTTRTYTDMTIHPVGALVEYQVRSGTLSVDGTWGNVAAVASWDAFRVTSIVVGNSGTLGTLNAGDTVVVTFSKPVLTSSMTVNTVRADNGGGDRGLYIGTTTSATNGVGKSAFSAFGATANYAGTTTWSNANATWTWASSVAGTTMSAALANEAFTIGSAPKCAADGTSSLNGTYQPTSSGRW